MHGRGRFDLSGIQPPSRYDVFGHIASDKVTGILVDTGAPKVCHPVELKKHRDSRTHKQPLS